MRIKNPALRRLWEYVVITFGSALAMVISYTTWHSVGWAIFHGLLSWVYVVYFVLRY